MGRPGLYCPSKSFTDEHDTIGTHWVILDEGRPMTAAYTVVKALSSPDPEGLDGFEEFVKDPFASLTKCVVDPQFRGHCLSNGVAELAFRMRN
jgi:hypothetical protein